MLLQDWKNSGSYYSYKNYKIFYKVSGEGEPLILIHGFPTCSWDWNKIWNTLAKKYRVYAIDMLGYGFSAKPTDFNYTIASQVDLWETFLKEKGIATFHILAHNYGDTVIQ